MNKLYQLRQPEFVGSPKTPSPLTGEGWGEGEDLRHFNYFGSPSPS